MALDAVANFVRGTTAAALDNTATTLSVTDATIFPDPGTQGEYNVVIWDADSFPRPDQDPSVEVLRVTARDTGADDLTVTRGQEGTSGAGHPSGSAVHLSPTAKMFSDIQTKTKGLSDDGNSLEIDSISRSSLSQDVTIQFPKISDIANLEVQATVVSTSPTQILAADGFVGPVWVAGDGDDGGRFLDRIDKIAGSRSVTTLITSNSPATRTYTTGASPSFDINLEMGSSTYRVSLMGLLMRPDFV